jgi:hypothetical protein
MVLVVMNIMIKERSFSLDIYCSQYNRECGVGGGGGVLNVMF